VPIPAVQGFRKGPLCDDRQRPPSPDRDRFPITPSFVHDFFADQYNQLIGRSGIYENPGIPLRGHGGASCSPGMFDAVSVQLLVGDPRRVYGDHAASRHGETQIEGFNSSNTLVFNTTIPIPPSGSAASDTPTQNAVLQADALLAAQSGLASTLPACSSGNPPCIAPDPGGSTVITNSTTGSYVAQDTVVSQQVSQYSTTLQGTVNGQTVFEQTYAAAFSDPAVQAAVSAADAILTADRATPGAPVQTSNSSALESSQSFYVLTGDTSATGTVTVSTTDTFGPNAITVEYPKSNDFR